MTGTLAASANSCSTPCEKVRAMIASTQRDRLRATSATGSRVPNPMS